ncbi:hypothetical protein, partial [Streptococcus pneumoniae]|uniref:hypothetical protein n=1 Tax=Streptococcus pneumoniae TaxID=1313 RepID=UPI001E3D977B
YNLGEIRVEYQSGQTNPGGEMTFTTTSVTGGTKTERMRINNTGGIGIGTTATGQIAASAQLDMQSTTKGFLPPRMTKTQRDAIASPAT